jgi:hypothetical protein
MPLSKNTLIACPNSSRGASICITTSRLTVRKIIWLPPNNPRSGHFADELAD